MMHLRAGFRCIVLRRIQYDQPESTSGDACDKHSRLVFSFNWSLFLQAGGVGRGDGILWGFTDALHGMANGLSSK